MRGCRTGMLLDELKCVTPNPIAHMPIRIAKRCIHPKYSTEMHQNTTFYAELNGEHAGEGFMSLRSILLEMSTRETKISWNFRKFDLWLAITGSNIDLGPKNNTINQSRVLGERNLLVFSAKFYDASFGNAKGGGVAPTNPPYTGEGGKTPFTGEG